MTVLAEAIDGFAELALELEKISRKATDKGVKRRALEAGAKLIVSRGKRIAAQHKRTGKLESGINSEYDGQSDAMNIGWSSEAFYGRILDNGATLTTGRRIQVQHLKASFEAEKENVMNKMLEVYKQEM